MAAQKKPQILNRISLNLLYPQGISQKIYVRFAKWLVSYGRFIVVIVEVVVVACFVFRFKLDNELIGLKEEINNQVQFLEQFEELEKEANHIHQRLRLIKQTFSYTDQHSKLLKIIASQTPINTTLTNVSFDESEEQANVLVFKLTGKTENNVEITGFLQNLKKEDKPLKDITLVNITFDNGTLIYTISGTSDENKKTASKKAES